MKGDGGGCEPQERDFFLSLGRSGCSSSEVVGFDDSLHMLSSLSRNGLSMLAGGASQITSLRNSAQPSGKVCGGGFTGFYRTTRGGSENHKPPTRSIAATTTAPTPAPAAAATVKPDVENLSPDECWRLILKLGSRWPAWNGAPASSPQVPTQDRNLEVEQDSLKVIASRALEALAQRPDRHSRPMLAPQKRTSIPILKPAIVEGPASRELATTTPLKAVVSSSTETRTAPLTIFYAGTVNVCNDVPEDKARLIMLFAEKARVPPRDVSPECVITEEVAEVGPSSSGAAAAAALEDGPESSPVSVKITISEGCKSRRQQGAAKPLPNARKNSLARFLDTRKRPSAGGSEGQKLSKKLSLGSDGCISDGDEMKSPKQLCSQSSFDSREGMHYNIMDAEMT